MTLNFNWKIIGGVAAGVLLLVIAVWVIFFRSSAPSTTQTGTGSLSVSDTRTTTNTNSTDTTDANQAQQVVAPQNNSQKIFKISNGPVAGAAFTQEGRPTTTIARFVMADSGHVFNFAVDSPGQVAQALSNTTIPGIVHVAWEAGGSAALLQYLDQGVIKTVFLGFPLAATSSIATSTTVVKQPIKIQFLLNNIQSLAVSPDSKSLAYLLKTNSGVDGYVAKADGSGGKKTFSLPLAQVVLSWPSAGTLLATSKPTAWVPGVAFSIDAKSGAVAPILYGNGITAIADSAFSRVVYQTAEAVRTTLVHNTKTNVDQALSFDPMPEKCVWSAATSTTMYCAAPLSYVPPNYLDAWHAGTASLADSLLSFDLTINRSKIIAEPGGQGGGTPSDILSLALSPDDKYLLFIKKGDRSLWVVRLAQ